MKVRYDVLLSKLGCPGIASVDKPHTCPKCHCDPPSMRISYLKKTTYFICSNCSMCVDAIRLAALCLGMAPRAARALFELGGPLHDTLVPGASEYTVTDYINATNSQAIINDIYTTARVRITQPVALATRNWLERRGVGSSIPVDTGSLHGATFRRLIKAGVICRTDTGDKRLYGDSEYVIHFTRYAGSISGMSVDCVSKRGGPARFAVTNGPETFAGGVYATHPEYAPTAETLYVFASPTELCRYYSKRFLYTRHPLGAIAITGLPLPPDYCRAKNIVFVTDGTDSFNSAIASMVAATDILSGAFRQPRLHVFDGRGHYETRTPENMLLQAVPLESWYTIRLLEAYRGGGEAAASALLTRSSDPTRVANLIGVHIPADITLAPLRKLLCDQEISSADIVDIPGTGRLYRTSNTIMAFPTPTDDGPRQITNFRIDVTKRIGMHRAGTVADYMIKVTFPSGGVYEIQVPRVVLNSATKFTNFIDARVREEDKPARFEHASITPAHVVPAFGKDLPLIQSPRVPIIRDNWLELPRIRINVEDGQIERQMEKAPVSRLSWFQGLSCDNYRESLASFRKIWGSKNPSDVALALCLAQTAFCFLSAVTCHRARAFNSTSCLVVVDDIRPFTRDLVAALCHTVHGGASTYSAGVKRIRSHRHVLPVVAVLPDARGDAPTLPVSPVILVAPPSTAVSAMALDRPEFLRYTTEHGTYRATKLSVVAHLQATFPYLLSEIVKRMRDMSHRLVSMQSLPAVYMYKLLASEFDLPVSELAEELISSECDGVGGAPLDVLFAALQHFLYRTQLLKLEHVDDIADVSPSRRAPASVYIAPDCVAINNALYGRIAEHSRTLYGYAPSRAVLRSVLAVSEYGYYLPSHEERYWCISRKAWDTRVESLRDADTAPALKLA